MVAGPAEPIYARDERDGVLELAAFYVLSGARVAVSAGPERVRLAEKSSIACNSCSQPRPLDPVPDPAPRPVRPP